MKKVICILMCLLLCGCVARDKSDALFSGDIAESNVIDREDDITVSESGVKGIYKLVR